MTTKPLLVLKKKILQIAIAYTFALLIVSLITIDFGGVDSIVPSYSDKIFHFLAYGLLTLLWFNALKIKFSISKTRALLIAAISCMVFGTIVEVLQKALTVSRFYDEADIFANIVGVLLMSLVLAITKKTQVK